MTMVEMNVSELSGVALDWAVAEAVGLKTVVCSPGQYRHDIKGGIHCSTSYGCHFGAPSLFGIDPNEYSPSTDWSQGGPLIEKHNLSLLPQIGGAYYAQWAVPNMDDYEEAELVAPSALLAICRAVVSKELGQAVQIPAELSGVQS